MPYNILDWAWPDPSIHNYGKGSGDIHICGCKINSPLKIFHKIFCSTLIILKIIKLLNVVPSHKSYYIFYAFHLSVIRTILLQPWRSCVNEKEGGAHLPQSSAK